MLYRCCVTMLCVHPVGHHACMKHGKQSVCLSVCRLSNEKNLMYRVKRLLNPKITLQSTKTSVSVYLIATKAFRISSSGLLIKRR